MCGWNIVFKGENDMRLEFRRLDLGTDHMGVLKNGY